MHAIFEVEGDYFAVATNQAVALMDELLRHSLQVTHGPGNDLAAAIVIEHHLIEGQDEPIRLTPQEGQAVLAALHRGRGCLRGAELGVLRDALKQRRRQELGL